MKRKMALIMALTMTLTSMSAGNVWAGSAVPASAGDVEINEANFPDANFRKCLLGDALEDLDGNSPAHDGVLSAGELAEIEFLHITDEDIRDLTGIEYFTNMVQLECMWNDISSLDLRKLTKLDRLECYGNPSLSELKLPSGTITFLDCNQTSIADLDFTLMPNLEHLRCGETKIKELDVSTLPKLRWLYCTGNEESEGLTSLKFGNNPVLEEVFCDKNSLTSLDVSTLPALKSLECSNNCLKDPSDIVGLQLKENSGLYFWPQKNSDKIPLSECTVTVSPKSQTYTGKKLKPKKVTVKYNGKTVPAKNYTITYGNIKNAGFGSVIITAKEGVDYVGSVTGEFDIKPRKPQSVKAKNSAKKTVKVTWKKRSEARAYEVQYSTKSNMKNAASVIADGKTSAVIDGLKKNKTYYVRVRALTANNPLFAPSAWSSKVKVKISK